MTDKTVSEENEENKEQNLVDEEIKDENLPLGFVDDRHTDPIQGINCVTQTWRMKERMKTVSVALVLCLNVGVDPPDVVKTQPCARYECWIDPLTMSASKALEKIGLTLQAQYERWQHRARYKQSLDPTAEEVRKLCISLRRNAKEERVLFHYNGHGVPKPTANGEIWVFNRTYTQYIPLSIYDLQTWMGSPSIYVYDCSNAGIIISSFQQFALQHENEYKQMAPQARGTSPPPNFRNCIQLAACSANQVLPMHPDLPADLFTSCLTTPIKVAVRWFLLQSTSKLVPKITVDLVDKIPGHVGDRRTMFGELNWIFTAITDTIAWNTLPRELFQRLFRQDLLVASLFRNFILAERILKSCDCTPISLPKLPSTYQHPMWNAWDLALDLCLGQLPDIVYLKKPFKNLPFFEEQLTAFEVWLELGCEEREPPEQLPIVLQVLLSQVHRMRALELLEKFLDLGPWAVNLALAVGIFPYVLKLLQSTARELRPLLVSIWAKVLAVDNTCQTDLVRENGHNYFISILQDTTFSAECRTNVIFVLAAIVNNFREGQKVVFQRAIGCINCEQFSEISSQFRQWIAICLGHLWDRYAKARWTAVRETMQEKLCSLLYDPNPEVRASAVYALGTFINSVSQSQRCVQSSNSLDYTVIINLLNTVGNDMSVLVRKEFVTALQWIILSFEYIYINLILNKYHLYPLEDIASIISGTKRLNNRTLRLSDDNGDRMKRVSSSSSIHSMTGQMKMSSSHSGSLGTLPNLPYFVLYLRIWHTLILYKNDPYPDIAKMSETIINHIKNLVDEYKSVDSKMNASLSLPPSPNRGNYLSGESPPSLHSSPDMQKYSRTTTINRKISPSAIITEETDEEIPNLRKPLITTNFIKWSAKKFAHPVDKDLKLKDIESRLYHERDWRNTRNNNIRREALNEQKRALVTKLDSQVFNTRTAIPPTILQFHPYDQQIAIAGRDSFGVWDWGTGAKTTVGQNKSQTSQYEPNKITSLEWINGHDVAMLMVGSSDGSIKLWKPNTGQSREPSLISAWQAFNDFKWTHSGVLMAWEQWTQTLITCGDNSFIKFWDCNKELLSYEIPTDTVSSVTCIDSTFNSICHEKYNKLLLNSCLIDDDLMSCKYNSKSGMIIVGFQDGCVRLFDRRCYPNESLVQLWREHNSTVLGVQCRDNIIISGCTNGEVKICDVRKSNSLLTTQALQSDMSCFAIHRGADIYACGSLNENVNIYTLDGKPLNTIKIYEGFMGHRTGPVTCLNFHPHKVALSMGTSDCSVSIYCLEGRR